MSAVTQSFCKFLIKIKCSPLNFELIFLNICSPIKNEHGKIDMSVRGVEIMNDDPSSVRVLYGMVQSDVLQQIGDGILKLFMNSGLSSMALCGELKLLTYSFPKID